MNSEIDEIIRRLELSPHPEGGFYKQTYASEEMIETEYGRRHAMTNIYYLLTKGDCSRWHRIRSSELWYHHKGGSLSIHMIDRDGKIVTQTLGNVIDNCEPVVKVLPNTWFSAEIADGSDYTLVSCAVCPGFDFMDFELAEKDQLSKAFPALTGIIDRLC